MRVTGNFILGQIRELMARRELLVARFPDTLTKFPGEDKQDPAHLSAEIMDIEMRIAGWQTVQAVFNTSAVVDVDRDLHKDGQVSLDYLVNIVGAYGRQAKIWKLAALGNKRDRYSYARDNVRSADEVHAVPTVTIAQAEAEYIDAQRTLTRLRAAIASANAQEIDVPEYLYWLF